MAQASSLTQLQAGIWLVKQIGQLTSVDDVLSSARVCRCTATPLLQCCGVRRNVTSINAAEHSQLSLQGAEYLFRVFADLGAWCSCMLDACHAQRCLDQFDALITDCHLNV